MGPDRVQGPGPNGFRPVTRVEMLVLEQLNSAVPLESRPSSVCLLLQQASRCRGPPTPVLSQHLCTTSVPGLHFHNISSFRTIRPIKQTAGKAGRATCNWIWNFLPDRPQVVRVGQKVSAQLRVSMGPHRAAALVLHSFHSTHRTVLSGQQLMTLLSSA